jgi:ubiquinone/menaquinone biosynthesis C-methylase UbiE
MSADSTTTTSASTDGQLITGLRARLYDLRQPIWRYIRQGHLRSVQLKPGYRLLDVGFGTGNTLAALYRSYGDMVELYGIEPSKDMAKEARRRLPGKNIHLQIAKAEDLPFGAGYFDYVLCSLVMHHLPFETKQKALQEIRRVLKPGGSLILSDWEKPTNAVGKALAWKWRNHAYVSENLQGLFARLLTEAGFKDIKNVSVQAGIVHHVRATK